MLEVRSSRPVPGAGWLLKAVLSPHWLPRQATLAEQWTKGSQARDGGGQRQDEQGHDRFVGSQVFLLGR